MTLRTRLTAAFLAVVLGPVLLGAVFVGYTVGAVSRDRAVHQLEVAAGAVHSAVSALCQQLHTTAELVATQPTAQQPIAATELVDRGLATAVRVVAEDGRTESLTPGAPPAPWTLCAGGPPDDDVSRFTAIAARVTVSAPAGGEVWVAARLDQQLVERLAVAAGVAVTLLGSAPVDSLHTTDDEVASSVAAAARLAPGQVAESADGRWVRRVDPTDGQPLPLVLAAPRAYPPGLYPLLIAVVAVAGLLAVLAAWRLGRATIRPLAELARAADQVAEGDLSVRVPVRTYDEAGRLAATFNRMTHRTQSYVQALTASRDQLRRHLTVLGETLSSTHDLERILQVILRTAQAATAARAGAVLLVDRRAGALVGTATCEVAGPSAGSQPSDQLAVSVPLGAGLLGAVAATGEARRGRVTVDGPALHGTEPRCRTYVVVPISAPGGLAATDAAWPTPPTIRGVLALYDRAGGDEFDDTDLVTLRTFAGQAGVAVDNVRTHEEAQRLSLTDPLTGLWNYRSLKESTRREVERATRFNHALAVLTLDLDRFKEVNDAYGHPAGDAVLAEFAQRIRSAIREVDLAFRHGGEEFVILLPETDARGAAVLAQRLGAAVRDDPVTIVPRGPEARGPEPRELPISVTVSIGIAVFPAHGVTPAELLEAADDALYAAKAAGRDTYRLAADRVDAGGAAVAPPAQPEPEQVTAAELAVRAGVARVPDDDLPHAGRANRGDERERNEQCGGEPAGTGDRPSVGGAQPPRQTRGR